MDSRRANGDYRSKCADARDCLGKLVVPTMANVSDKVDFKLSFIGKYVYTSIYRSNPTTNSHNSPAQPPKTTACNAPTAKPNA
jgi:hypothetical protein